MADPEIPRSDDESVNTPSSSSRSSYEPGPRRIPVHRRWILGANRIIEAAATASSEDFSGLQERVGRVRVQLSPVTVRNNEAAATMSYEELSALQERVGSVRVGLPPETVAALTAVEFRKQENDGEGESCTVCLERYGDGEKVVQLPCSHILHRHCAADLFNTTNRCPVCRREVAIENKETPERDNHT
jgi:hypothetical protein